MAGERERAGGIGAQPLLNQRVDRRFAEGVRAQDHRYGIGQQLGKQRMLDLHGA
jgi:hypothetical protein